MSPIPITIADTHRLNVTTKDAFFRRVLITDLSVQKKMVTLVTSELLSMIHSNEIDLIEEYYPTIVRLAQTVPFPIMREAFLHIQLKIETTWPFLCKPVGYRVSYFMENAILPSILHPFNEEVYQLFCQAFLETGRVSHFTQVLAWHPSYLRLFRSSIQSIMVRDGTLPLPWRHYIALMAASELRCHYVADCSQYLFVLQGGEQEWIQGMEYISPKLFRLHELSSLLAHRPWLLTSQHIGELLCCMDGSSWSVAELVHAIIVLCTHHSMCSIALGLGLVEEQDIWKEDGASAVAEQQAIEEMNKSGSVEEDDMALIERDDKLVLKRLQSKERLSETTEEEDEDEEEDDEEEEECPEKEFEGVEQDTGYTITSERRRRDTLWRFCSGSVIKYTDFNVHSTEYRVVHTEDFSWEAHGFSLVKRYFPGDAGQMLEDLFHLTDTMTYETFGTEAMDTSPYRMAIWYYVHRLFGICHDDYDYRNVNIYLNRPTKIFIKKVACTPWKVTQNDFKHFDRTLSSSEKCHVTLLVAEARKQAGLIYGLRAVMQYMR